MSYEYRPVDWAQFEASREAILAEQDVVQATIDESMRKGDLFEAGVASLEHVLTSYELGDPKEAAAYLAIGVALSTGGTFAVPEHLRHESNKDFELPEAITRMPFEITNRYRHVVASTPESLEAEKAIDEMADNLISAESLINSEFSSIETKNRAIHDAVKSIGDFYFSDLFIPGRDTDDIVTLVKDLAENIEVDDEPKNKRLAFDTYRRLAAIALGCEGKTNSALNAAARGFKELSVFSDNVSDDAGYRMCKEHIDWVRITQLEKLTSSPLVLAKNLSISATKRRAISTGMHRTSASEMTRTKAKMEYREINLRLLDTELGGDYVRPIAFTTRD